MTYPKRSHRNPWPYVALTEEELRRLLIEAKNPTSRSRKRGYLSAQPWFYAAVAFAAYTGCRRGEAVAIRWQDVSFENKSVTIARSLTESMTFKAPKNDKTRTIAMPEALAALLKSHRAAQAEERLFLGPAYKDQDLVFAHADGSAIDPWNFGSAVRDLILRAGVTPITLHGLRDTMQASARRWAYSSKSSRTGSAMRRSESRRAAICTSIPTGTRRPRTPSIGCSARNERGSAVARLLHGASKCRENPYGIRTK
jgi:integrase